MKTIIVLDYQELSTVLAALRTAQEDRPIFEQMPHFLDVEPLDDEAIDELCEHINCGGDFTDDEAKAMLAALRGEDVDLATTGRAAGKLETAIEGN
jgi:hypothetical protein